MKVDKPNSVTADYIVTEVLSDTYDDAGILREKCYRWLFRIWTRLNLSMIRTPRTMLLPIAQGTKTMWLPPDYQDFIFLGFPDNCGNWLPIAINRNLMPRVGIENANVCDTCGEINLCSLDMEQWDEPVIINGQPYTKTTSRIIQPDGSYTEEVTGPVINYDSGHAAPPPPPVVTQLHGVQIDNTIATAAKIDIAHALNVNCVRMAIYIQGNVGDTIAGMGAYGQYIAAGVKVMVNMNWQPVGGTANPWQTDMTAYAARVNEALDQIQAIGAPELIAIENEFFNIDYHSGTAAEYITILSTAAPLVQARGYKVTDSGLNTYLLSVYVYRGLAAGNPALGAQLGAVAFTPAQQAAIDNDTIPPDVAQQIDDQQAVMNTVISTCNYMNMHYYEISNPNLDLATTATANHIIVETIARYVTNTWNIKMVFNEYGIQNNSQTALVTSLLDALDGVKDEVVMCSFFSGAAGEPAIQLAEDNAPYLLTAAGNAFAAWHTPAVRAKVTDTAYDIEMQTTKRTVCTLDKSCQSCVPATPGNLQLLTGCGCQAALCCCSNDLLPHDVKPSNVHYNLFEQEGFIQFNPECCLKQAILKYVSSGKCINGTYYFPIETMEVLISGVYYRSIEKKRNVPQVEKDRARKAHTAEKKELLRDYTKLSYQEWLQMIDQVPRIPTIDAGGGGGLCVSNRPPLVIGLPELPAPTPGVWIDADSAKVADADNKNIRYH